MRLKYLVWAIQRLADPGERLLEVGFGSGATSVLLADLGYQVTAVDIDPELVATGRERYADWRRRGPLVIEQGDMFHLPWGTRSFSLVFHQGVLEHFADERIVEALKEQARIATWIVFDVPNHRHRLKPFGDERLLPPSHWRRLILEAGLILVEEGGRDFQRWLYLLPHAVFSRWGVERLGWLLRRLAINSVFVCRGR